VEHLGIVAVGNPGGLGMPRLSVPRWGTEGTDQFRVQIGTVWSPNQAPKAPAAHQELSARRKARIRGHAVPPTRPATVSAALRNSSRHRATAWVYAPMAPSAGLSMNMGFCASCANSIRLW